jgi:thymidine kinase
MKFVLDGNIGCGKSSIINKIIESKCINLPVFNEPIEEWDQWLELFYSDMTKYSFGFQMRVLKSHLNNKSIENGIFERSLLSCQRVFGELLYEDKLMTELEWNLTEEFNNDFGWTPHVIIYLKCNPDICYERIHKRNRNSEHQITLEYIERIHGKYEKLYNNQLNIKVIEIDASQSIDKMFNDILSVIKN